MLKYILIVLAILVFLVSLQYLVPGHLFSKDSDSCPKLTGRIVWKGKEDYDQARLVSNFYVSRDKFPKAIVYCQSTEDVQNAIKWARCHHVPMRIRSGGHHHEGYSTGNDVLVIDVSEMKELKLDRTNNVAIIQPGLSNAELYNRLFQDKLTHVGGTCSDVGSSGLVLTGGMGPLLRRFGLTCDTLISCELVDANGEVITVTKENEHKDLFWALCGGGGGNFGVVTSMKIRVYPAQNVTWFNIGWDWNQPVEAIINAWQDFFAIPDKQWFSHIDMWANPFPEEKLNKKPIKVLGMYFGTAEEGRKQLAPLLKIGNPSIDIREVDWNQSIKLIEDSTAVFLTDKPEYRSIGAFAMERLPQDGIDIIVNTLRNSESPLLNVLIFSMGGATAEIAPTATAYYYRKAKFFFSYNSQWLEKNNDKKQIEELQNLRHRLLPYTIGNYIGNPDPTLKNYLKEYFGGNVERLQCVKKKYDPDNLFQFEQSIPPASSENRCN